MRHRKCDSICVLVLLCTFACFALDHDHWWSGCQIYGTSAERNRQLRSGLDGKLLLNRDGSYLELDATGGGLQGLMVEGADQAVAAAATGFNPIIP
jgi:hypothetical protein